MSKVLIVHTGWYRKSVKKMNQFSIEVIEKKYTFAKV